MLDTKKILQANLTELLKTRPEISRINLSKIMGVADGTLGRIKYGTGNPTVEVLEQIARFFKVQPWQLLSENLGRKTVEEKSGSSTVSHLDLELFESLPDDIKKEIAELIEFKAERWNQKPTNSRHGAG